MTRIRHASRPGFTLIELLMVLAIIGVLVALLMAAVFRASEKGEEASARSDITQLAQAIEAFKTKYSVKDPPPSRLWLGPAGPSGYDPNNPLHVDSKEYLGRIWPRLDLANATWGGASGVELQGHQVLVFFLGGMPTPAGMDGFSTDPRQPYKTGGDRTKSFDFKTARLDYSYGQYPAYIDAFGKAPYLYFSSYKSANGYNRYYKFGGQLRRSDCHSVSDGDKQIVAVWPYALAITDPQKMEGKYLNAETYQIVCCGSDGKYGSGTAPPGSLVWKPAQAIYPAGQPGHDDMSNFHDRVLGSVN